METNSQLFVYVIDNVLLSNCETDPLTEGQTPAPTPTPAAAPATLSTDRDVDLGLAPEDLELPEGGVTPTPG